MPAIKFFGGPADGYEVELDDPQPTFRLTVLDEPLHQAWNRISEATDYSEVQTSQAEYHLTQPGLYVFASLRKQNS
jgi:hypothetical protein